MKKSIEKIWKEGFINNNSFSIPKIDDIQSLKSIYFVDKFKETYKTNIIILIVTAVLVLFASILSGIPIIGLIIFGLFAILAILGTIELNRLEKLNPGASNYEFLLAFDNWLKNLIDKFSKIYRFWMPLLFISFAFGILQTNFFVPFIGETLMDKILDSSNIYLIAGVPIFWIMGILSIAIVLSYFSNRFFKIEMKSIYGDLINKLNNSLTELEELR